MSIWCAESSREKSTLGVKALMSLLGEDGMAEFILDLQDAVDGLSRNNGKYSDALRESLDDLNELRNACRSLINTILDHKEDLEDVGSQRHRDAAVKIVPLVLDVMRIVDDTSQAGEERQPE